MQFSVMMHAVCHIYMRICMCIMCVYAYEYCMLLVRNQYTSELATTNKLTDTDTQK
jgi:hypothetical protein